MGIKYALLLGKEINRLKIVDLQSETISKLPYFSSL
jgi:hypothetical protein